MVLYKVRAELVALLIRRDGFVYISALDAEGDLSYREHTAIDRGDCAKIDMLNRWRGRVGVLDAVVGISPHPIQPMVEQALAGPRPISHPCCEGGQSVESLN